MAATLPLPPLLTGGTAIERAIAKADPGVILVAVIYISHLVTSPLPPLLTDPGTIVAAVTSLLPPLLTGGTAIERAIPEADTRTILVAVISISHLVTLPLPPLLTDPGTIVVAVTSLLPPLITGGTAIERAIAEADPGMILVVVIYNSHLVTLPLPPLLTDPGTIVVAVNLLLPPLLTGGTAIKQAIVKADPGTILVAVISISYLY